MTPVDSLAMLPVEVRRVLRRARRSYRTGRLQDRSSLRQPWNYVGLFTLPDLLTLAKSSYWPLPPQALAWIAEVPADRARRRRCRQRLLLGQLAKPIGELVAVLQQGGAR